MKSLFSAVTLAALAVAHTVQAAPPTPEAIYIRDCLTAAGNSYREPPALLVILLNVEGGRLGAVSQNTNGTVDIGPMQVNNIWLSKLAAHWATSPHAAYVALRDNFCANIEAGAWILRMGLDDAHGDFWDGVGFYHSHDPGSKRTYLNSVLMQALQLQMKAGNTNPVWPPSLPREAADSLHMSAPAMSPRQTRVSEGY